MPQIFDNIKNHLSEGLNYTLDVSYKADFCVGYFNLRGWKQVAHHIEKWNGGENNNCRLLVGMQKPPLETIRDYFSKTEQGVIDNQTAISIKKKLAQEFKDQLTIGIPTEDDEIGLRKLSSQIKQKKVVVKLFLRHPLHAKLYLCFRDDRINPVIGYLGSSNLTLSGLSLQGELNVDVLEKDATEKLSNWFADRWDDKFCLDISDELAEIIDNSWASDKLISPYHIYLKIAYHLAREARAGLSEFKVSKVFEKQLLDFQMKAVLVAAHHLNKRGGVIIGDVVGLGKTITATALAKMFEDDFFLETLILCPKNLTEMWKDYAHKYQLRAQVLSVTQAQSELPKMRRYRLIIIDESHNLRNREGKRYKAIQEYIQLNDSKVILLSATPYNKTFLDLSNQLRLFIPDEKDLGISPEHFIESIGGKTQFMAKYQTPLRSIPAFEKSEFADDWRELMRLYLVRRTRSFIKLYYTNLDETNNRKFLTFADGSRSYFPDRLPKKVEYQFDLNDPKDQYAKLYSDEVVDLINHLNLPRYGLGQEQYNEKKPLVKPTKEDLLIQQNLGRAGARLKGFARTNLFKRLESSGYSFLLSISRHILRNYLFIYAIENKLAFPIGKQDAIMLDDYLEDTDIDGTDTDEKINLLLSEESYYTQAQKIYDLFSTTYKNRFDWVNSSLFSKSLKNALIQDSRDLIKILELGKDWNANEDRKLNALYKLINKKHNKEKVLIFTQYADTAYYLCDELKKRGLQKVECVTGNNESPTSFAYRFSPVSNDKKNDVKETDEIRVLITTDVLSEGQNLQDAHVILNYDLPWAIIRLIQRAGRVDRIGQKAEQIFCYSFLPEDGIEKIIRLRSRLKTRLEQSDEVLGSPDEVFFDNQKIRTQLEGLYSEQSGILDEEEDGEVDLASYAYQIWKNATDANPKLNNIIPEMPNVVYATKKNNDEKEKQGVIVYSRTADDNDILVWVNSKGEVITQSQLTILKAAQCNAEITPLYKIPEHHNLVAKGLEYINDIEITTGGQLGKQNSVRYRIYMHLNRYYEEFKNTLFATDALKRAIDDIYKYPLKESAKDTIGRQLKAGVTVGVLIDLVSALREEDKLCIITEEDNKYREPQIICSLGIKNEEE
ncbi:MAG: NgoFVII family restriction endonuclease [Bacteroidetes bacterium RIFOXYA12_FULL_35_11]|nr:MAG: NgoFVII family restriction endonuclease [Bacteroidetes bacterium GWF2_35_48]OFY75519.1 MAG: NgoFVII family restriction endonuclease [Bacteroidetes bacterium RIFOXYA12_FULL_35_11]HBX51252.1 NgoFVII family restriction endonuclease [Bacteroidales bacterium]